MNARPPAIAANAPTPVQTPLPIRCEADAPKIPNSRRSRSLFAAGRGAQRQDNRNCNARGREPHYTKSLVVARIQTQHGSQPLRKSRLPQGTRPPNRAVQMFFFPTGVYRLASKPEFAASPWERRPALIHRRRAARGSSSRPSCRLQLPSSACGQSSERPEITYAFLETERCSKHFLSSKYCLY